MKSISKLLALAGAGIILGFSSGDVMAQERGGRGGNFDPEEFRQRMMDRYKEQLEVTSDDEWKVISGRIGAVLEARQAAGGGGRGFGGFRGGRRGGDEGDRGGRGGGRGFGGEPDADVEALAKAVESNASSDQIKAALAKVKASQEAKQKTLADAEQKLREVLSARQQANAVLTGLLRF